MHTIHTFISETFPIAQNILYTTTRKINIPFQYDEN